MRVVLQSTARNVTVLMVSSSDHVTGVAGLTLTMTASKNGGAFASITPTVTDLGNGWYNLALTSTHTNTLGDLAIHVTGSTADPTDTIVQVVAYNFADAVHLGLSALPNAAAAAAGGLPTFGTGAGQINVDGAGNVESNVNLWQTSTPNALISGRVDSSTGAMASGVVTESALSATVIQDLGIIHSGTSTGGGASNIDLDAGASSINGTYVGEIIQIISGTGAGQTRLIVGYLASGNDATVLPAWATQPDTTSVFRIMASSGQVELAALTSASFDNSVNIQIVHTGTAQAGAAGTITLDSGASLTSSLYVGCIVYIVSGTGAGQARLISVYNGATKVATVASNWTTTPNNTSVFQLFPTVDYVTETSATVRANVEQWNSSGVNNLISGRVDASIGAVQSAVITDAAFDSTALTDFGVTRSGTAQAGGASTITLDSGAVATNSYYVGQLVQIVSGTGAGQVALITAYVGSTKVATIATVWATNPDSTSVFRTRAFSGQLETGTVPSVNVSKWNGSAVATPNVAGIPKVDLVDWLGSVPNALISGRVDVSVGAYQTGQAPLQPVVAGRALAIDSTGHAGIDWSNISNPTSTIDLSGTTILDVTDVETAIAAINATFIADAVWDALPSAHTTAGTYGELCARPTGAVIANGSNTTLTFKTNLTASSDSTYDDAFCCFLSGALAGQVHKVTGYTAATAFLTFTTAFTAIPSGTDRFMLVNK